MLGIVLRTVAMAVNKNRKISCPHRAYILETDSIIKLFQAEINDRRKKIKQGQKIEGQRGRRPF